MIKYSAVLIIFFSILSACSEDSGSNSLSPEFSAIYSDVLSLRCAKGGCHDGGHPRLNMPTKELAYSNLLNLNSSQGLKYIQPGSADSSYLFLKIILDPSGRSGARMPRDGETNGYLTNNQIAAIRDWIQDGAPDN